MQRIELLFVSVMITSSLPFEERPIRVISILIFPTRPFHLNMVESIRVGFPFLVYSLGFYDLAVSINMDRLSALIDDKTKILVCGHSMGGSAAIILYYLLAERFSSNECKVITFGAPLCFTREVLSHSVKMNNIVNIIHEEDTIPFVTSPDHYLSQLNRITSTIYSFCSHFIDKTRLDSTLSKYTTDIKSFITSQLYYYPVGTFYVVFFMQWLYL